MDVEVISDEENAFGVLVIVVVVVVLAETVLSPDDMCICVEVSVWEP